jgi:hypothetical protein
MVLGQPVMDTNLEPKRGATVLEARVGSPSFLGEAKCLFLESFGSMRGKSGLMLSR